MRYRDIILTANSNLRKSKLRTFLTISAVFIGALTLMLTTGVGAGLKTYVQEQLSAAGAEDVLIITQQFDGGNPISDDQVQEYDPEGPASGGMGTMPMLNQDDLAAISEEEGIESVEPNYPVSAEYITTGEAKYVVNLSQAVEGLNTPLRAGRLVDVNSTEPEVTLTSALIEPLGFSGSEAAVGEQVIFGFKNSQGEVFTKQATIVGVQEKTLIQYNAMNGNMALIREAYQQATDGLSEFQKQQYPAALAKFDDSISEAQLDDLQSKLNEQGYSAQTLDDQLGVVTSIIDGIITFLNIFAAIALIAATFGIVNTLLMAVQERTREIGLMKALGMGRRKIFTLFSLEAVLIGFWGSILAVVAANIIGRIGSNIASDTILKDFDGLELFSFPATSMIPIVLLIMGIALLAATLPARRASRLDPINALRYE